MKKVITYGTFDLLHYGHLRLLSRAKALGDYLIVGVTSDDYDKSRGKINVRQSAYERMEAVRATGLADEIILEEYEGQKIDDIRKYGVDVFAIGSDWEGAFDYLKEYCEVVYLERTEGVSSSGLRSEEKQLKLGLYGEATNVDKVERECAFVNGITVSGKAKDEAGFEALLKSSDAVYLFAAPEEKAALIRKALEKGKHVLAESPLLSDEEELQKLDALAKEKGLILMEALKTAFSTAYRRLVLMLKGGKIGQIVSVDAACTSMQERMSADAGANGLGSLYDWGPTAMLPVFQLLGTAYQKKQLYSLPEKENASLDAFTRLDFIYDHAVASVRVGKGVKSEGELVVTGTRGCAYVPAPWWKTDFFEIRYEDPSENQRFFYQLEGEGIRYELKAFLDLCSGRNQGTEIERVVSEAIVKVMEDWKEGRDLTLLSGE